MSSTFKGVNMANSKQADKKKKQNKIVLGDKKKARKDLDAFLRAKAKQK